ncbi:zinc metalloprotease [Nocardioides sp.]|uniref:zinc metalloprotease n=1 Tax=Nocardioides sp. TaxID=35761 RepID=UPI001A2D81F9|nr:zinc metalloprotease [Nocardioides sp.]MBJ7358420.1 zinc metalloprotease [Nocardioides sp.]
MRLSTWRAPLALGGTALVASTLSVAGLAAPAAARPVLDRQCVTTDTHVGGSARGGFGERDHRAVSAQEQRTIRRQTARALRLKGVSPKVAAGATATVPVYVHVMRDANGTGDVTDKQITQQIAVLNKTFAGGESSTAADTGFSFSLAGTFRYNNNQWHQDKSSTTYRKATRKGGADALNIWLVDFKYLGIATFPWDYQKSPGIDGIRVHYASLPGGDIANYDQGETATHEAGHWFGLYHTFQGGCTDTNDEVADTPAQAGPTSGCPEGQDTCPAPGSDPIHNYMDYSYDSCYTEFSAGQSARAGQMWTAYRG